MTLKNTVGNYFGNEDVFIAPFILRLCSNSAVASLRNIVFLYFLKLRKFEIIIIFNVNFLFQIRIFCLTMDKREYLVGQRGGKMWYYGVYLYKMVKNND